MSRCTCEWCETISRFRRICDLLPADDAAFVMKFVESHEHTAMDLNWYQAVTDGSWPDSENILRGWLAHTTTPQPEGQGAEGQGA
jgi:hypothetical protein